MTRPRQTETEPEPEKQEVPFEKSIQELAQIVDRLEGGELPLDESIELFERGMKIAKRSQAQLDHAEKRVEELLSVDEDGNPDTAPFDEEDSISF